MPQLRRLEHKDGTRTLQYRTVKWSVRERGGPYKPPKVKRVEVPVEKERE